MTLFSNSLVGFQCVVVPILVGLLMLLWYFAAVGSISIKGVAREKLDSSKHWITIGDLTRKFMQVFASITMLIGGLVAFTGFTRPWVSASASTLFSGSVSGLGMLIGSFVGVFGLFGEEGGLWAGIVLLLLGLLLLLFTIVLLALLVITFLRFITHLGYMKRGPEVFLKPALIVVIIAFVVGFIFLGLTQLLTSIEVDVAFMPQITLGEGFNSTLGGIFIALVGVIWATKITDMFAGWIDKLTGLALD